MTSSPTGRSCSKCNTWKPLSAFNRTEQGWSTHRKAWCAACKAKARKEWQQNNPDAHFVHRELERSKRHTVRALWYSRSVCAQVEKYVAHKIRRFEQRTGMDAPPHMTALLQVAQSITAQHPAIREDLRSEFFRRSLVERTEYGKSVLMHPVTGIRYLPTKQSGRTVERAELRHCDECQQPVGWRRRGEYFFRHGAICLECRERLTSLAHQRRNEQARTDHKNNPIRLARRLDRKITADLAALYRLNGATWEEITKRFGFSSPGHAHNVVYGGDHRAYAPLRTPHFKPVGGH